MIITADIARNLSAHHSAVANFLELIDRKIRDACGDGDRSINISLPGEFTPEQQETVVEYFRNNGFEVFYSDVCLCYQFKW